MSSEKARSSAPDIMSAARLACGCTMYDGVWSYCYHHQAQYASDRAFPQVSGPSKGWQCPACGTVYAPWVYSCQQAHAVPATGANDER